MNLTFFLAQYSRKAISKYIEKCLLIFHEKCSIELKKFKLYGDKIYNFSLLHTVTLLMFVFRFLNVLAAETYITSCQLVEIIHYEYQSTKKFFKSRRIKNELKKKMNHANSYAEWKAYAMEYDKETGKPISLFIFLSFYVSITWLKIFFYKYIDTQRWKEAHQSEHYDWEYIKGIIQILREAREKDEFLKIINIIRSNAMRNIGNILDPALYARSFIGTKSLIEDFQQEVLTLILVI